jgi:hypothetical protein
VKVSLDGFRVVQKHGASALCFAFALYTLIVF